MMEFGKTLREAREAKGYSTSQLAEITHILPQIITGLEAEDFSRIVAPIYGRGFVKLYCEAVGLDPKPLQTAFMDILNGNVPAASAPTPEPQVAEPEPPPVSAATLLTQPAENAAPQVAEAPESPFAEFDPREAELDAHNTTVPHREYRLPGHSMQEIPPSFWRFGVLAVAAIAIIILLCFGIRALYRATMGIDDEAAEEAPKVEKVETAATVKTEKTAKAAKSDKTEKTKPRPQAPRKVVRTPPLYID